MFPLDKSWNDCWILLIKTPLDEAGQGEDNPFAEGCSHSSFARKQSHHVLCYNQLVWCVMKQTSSQRWNNHPIPNSVVLACNMHSESHRCWETSPKEDPLVAPKVPSLTSANLFLLVRPISRPSGDSVIPLSMHHCPRALPLSSRSCCGWIPIFQARPVHFMRRRPIRNDPSKHLSWQGQWFYRGNDW